MARSSMTTLITRLRELTSAETDEFTLNGVDYFSDDHLQAILDEASIIHTRVALYPIGEFADGAMLYRRYPLPHTLTWIEGAGDDSVWALVDGNHADAPVHSLKTDARQVIFDMPTDGRTYYLSASGYDMHRAVMTVWSQKAAHVAQRVSFSVDGQQVTASDYHAHCLKMVVYYEKLAGAIMVRRIRMDEV